MYNVHEVDSGVGGDHIGSKDHSHFKCFVVVWEFGEDSGTLEVVQTTEVHVDLHVDGGEHALVDLREELQRGFAWGRATKDGESHSKHRVEDDLAGCICRVSNETIEGLLEFGVLAAGHARAHVSDRLGHHKTPGLHLLAIEHAIAVNIALVGNELHKWMFLNAWLRQ